MCYYISFTLSRNDIELRFNAKFPHPELFYRVYSTSAFSFPLMPVISDDNPQNIQFYQWGLIPFWVKDNSTVDKIRQRTLNARAETIFEKPAFRHSIRSKRCYSYCFYRDGKHHNSTMFFKLPLLGKISGDRYGSYEQESNGKVYYSYNPRIKSHMHSPQAIVDVGLLKYPTTADYSCFSSISFIGSQ